MKLTTAAKRVIIIKNNKILTL